MIDEHAVVEERGLCICTGCTGFFRRCRDGSGELMLVCTHCALSVEAPFLDEQAAPRKTKRKHASG